ncbi:MFS-type transporter oryC [Psilocybe cubensis]|uniref:MFS-type transporter oryC n=1 Tax=Psilocybe cubensis TaxID=181762 RepID=A0ACB8H4V9_PSICU|nr:MFS-type transporter oryC [Psilocybe cubensis]KAH9482803.1 MFS-type transporter oryC [Psilocybe cubensis]
MTARLLKAGRPAEAMAVISALEDKPPTDANVKQTFEAIKEAVIAEGMDLTNVASSHDSQKSQSSKASLRELFTGGRGQNFRRTLLFERLQISDTKSRIIAACNATEYFMASFIAVFLIERVGRRKLMFFGSFGQTGTMVLLAILGSINNAAARIISAILFRLVGYDLALLYPTGTPQPAEIVGLRMRGPANALSTASNWTFNFLVVMITGPAFENISWRTYIIFATLNAAIIPCVYFFFPETAGRSLEDMDIIFAIAYNESVSPVAVSLRKDIPKAGSAEANRILGLDERESEDRR